MDRNGLFLISCLLIAALTGIVSASDNLKVYYLNTSHGDATLLESSGHFMVINAGEKQDSAAVIDYLKMTGVTMLDYAVATSLNESAIGGMADMMREFPVSVYIDPSTSFSSSSHDAIKKKIQADQIGYQQAATGSSLPFGAATIQILNTSTSSKDGSDNAMSLSVGLGNVSYLFTGNQNLGPTPATIWAVPNQGRDGSIASLSAISPQVLVISTGTDGPDKKTLDTLKTLKSTYLLTNKDGNIVISTDGKDYHIVTSNEKTLQKPTSTVTPTLKPATVQPASAPLSGTRAINQS